MRKELNPQLFGEMGLKTRVVEKNAAPPTLHLEQKVSETKQQVHQVTEALHRIVQQMNEYMKSNHAKMERVSSTLQKLEQNDQELVAQASEKISQIAARVGERKSMDLKVQELVDRQNSVLRTYEVRLNQLQMLINEKDAQLVSTQAALNEAKMEIARLKRI